MTRRQDQDPMLSLDKRELMRRVAAQAAYFAIGASGVWGGPNVPKIGMEKPMSPNTFGVSGSVNNSPELGIGFDTMRQHGATTVRFDIGWPGVEPNAPEGGVHTYNWSATDAAMVTLHSHGMTPYPVAGYAPRWASGQENYFSPPTDPNQYAAFIKHLVDRYAEKDNGEKGTFFQENPGLPYKPIDKIEFWNEINLKQFFRDNGPTPLLTYLRLYEAARDAINLEHKNVTVVFGSFLDNIHAGYNAAEAMKELDRRVPGVFKGVEAVAIHPYYSTASQVINRFIQVRIALNEIEGQDAEIHASEVGTYRGVASPEQSGEMLRKLVEWVNSGCNKKVYKVDNILTYTTMDDGADSDPETIAGGGFEWFTVFRKDGQPTTSGRAFLGAAATATTRPRKRCDRVKHNPRTRKALKDGKYKTRKGDHMSKKMRR